MKLTFPGPRNEEPDARPAGRAPHPGADAGGPPPGRMAPGLLRPLGTRLAISRGHSVVLADHEGRLCGGTTGFFHHQSRFLSRLELKVAGRRPESASAAVIAPDELTARFRSALPRSMVKDRRLHTLAPERMLEVQLDWQVSAGLAAVFRLTNRTPAPIAMPLSWSLDADFADQGQLTAGRRRPRLSVQRVWVEPATLILRSLHPRLRHATRIECRGPVAFKQAGKDIHCELDLAPQETVEIRFEAAPMFDPAHADQLPPQTGSEGATEAWLQGCARLAAADGVVQAAWDGAACDLHSLQFGDGDGEERFTPAAGVPHYLALFGRDTLMTGWQTALLNPATQRGALDLVGPWTAAEVEPRYDAQPGRVLHQRALGPMALLGKTPFLRYYGDHSASALFLIGLAAAYARSGDARWLRKRRDLALRVLDWMDRDGDLDGDGLYEYRTFAGPHGLKNQGWKDSGEAILYPDGAPVADPIVVCEIQAMFAAAKHAMGCAFASTGDDALAQDLQRQADAARRRFEQALWMENEGFVALGLDAEKRQIRTLASNAGESLAYGPLDTAKARRVADRIMQADFFTGWGLRTLPSSHPAYDPLGYHIGSVWPCFTALTARGFARYGFTDHLHALAGALFDATQLFERGRLPELFGGHPRDASGRRPGLYRDACWPQAWSAGAIILLVDTLVGLKPAAPLGAALIEPKLPEWLAQVRLKGVELGRGRLDLEVRRDPNGEMGCRVFANTTGLRIVGPGLEDDASPAQSAALKAYVESLP